MGFLLTAAGNVQICPGFWIWWGLGLLKLQLLYRLVIVRLTATGALLINDVTTAQTGSFICPTGEDKCRDSTCITPGLTES
ncbi:MAG TPA: hypothetical protein V6D03_01550 [Candidatus Caenarcaniphilales bacterium]